MNKWFKRLKRKCFLRWKKCSLSRVLCGGLLRRGAVGHALGTGSAHSRRWSLRRVTWEHSGSHQGRNSGQWFDPVFSESSSFSSCWKGLTFTLFPVPWSRSHFLKHISLPSYGLLVLISGRTADAPKAGDRITTWNLCEEEVSRPTKSGYFVKALNLSLTDLHSI